MKKYAAAIGDPSRLQAPRVLRGTREASDGKPLPMELQESNGRVHIAVNLGEGKLEQWQDATGGASRDAKGIVHKFNASSAENFRQLTNAFSPLLPAAIPKDARVVNQEKIGDHDAYVVAARIDERTRVRYYFDTASGLLLRRVTIMETPIGPVPQQTDFDDYRDSGGTKFPFLVKVSLVDPWVGSIRRYSEVELGAKIDDSVFSLPAETPPSS